MGEKATIVIVEDDESVRDALTLYLDRVGYTVEAFASADAFLATGQIPTNGCLLLDIQMPGMTGLELQEHLNKTHPDPYPLVFLTGHGDIPMAVSAIRKGASDFLEKPVDMGSLEETLRRAMASQTEAKAESPDVAAIRIRIESLTKREREVLEQLVIGNPNKVIAYELGISSRTVENHRAQVMRKMEARSLSELVRMRLAIGS